MERVLAESELSGIEFFERGMIAARRVARIVIRHGNRVTGYGTGVLVSPRLLLTNNHVLESAGVARESTAEFEYVTSGVGAREPVVYRMEPSVFFETDSALDFTLVALEAVNAAGRSLSDRGWCPLIPGSGKALKSERVNIIQHPGGERMQVTVRENTVVAVVDSFLHYQADTNPGSSGSPVFNDLWEMAALHHAGVPAQDASGRYLLKDGSPWDGTRGTVHLIEWIANEGVRISSIVKHVNSLPFRSEERELWEQVFQRPRHVDVWDLFHSRIGPGNPSPSEGLARVPVGEDAGGAATWLFRLSFGPVAAEARQPMIQVPSQPAVSDPIPMPPLGPAATADPIVPPTGPKIADPLPGANDDFEQTFIVELALADAEAVAERLAEPIPGVERIHSEPVFQSNESFQRVRVRCTDRSRETNPFGLAESLRAGWRAKSVEPDLATEYYPVDSDRPPDAPLESTKLFGCWVGDGEPAPPDVAWALRKMRLPEAWAYSAEAGRPAMGEGIIIAQPDTGVTDHGELEGTLDKTRWLDLLDGGSPIDPLEDGLGDSPGHGTATGSVVISRGTVTQTGTGAPGIVTGSAPKANLAPIRCIESVMRITQSRVARAIEHAVDAECHVITMSLGGLWSRALSKALDYAIHRNVIVLAAAGNCVKAVVWPARFRRCIAVAGSNVHDKRWKGSSRGSAVDIAAPAQHVYRARRKPDSTDMDDVAPSEGTSYAVALTAGVAACWLAHHGRKAILDSLGDGERLQDRFSKLLKETARKPEGWKKKFGAGIVDAEALLQAPLSDPSPGAELSRGGTESEATAGDVAREFFASTLGDNIDLTEEFDAVAAAHGLEMVALALQNAVCSEPTAEAAFSVSAGLEASLARRVHRPLAEALRVQPAIGETRVEARDDDFHLDVDAEEVQQSPKEAESFRLGLEADRWRVAECLLKLREQVDTLAPGRSRASDGTIGDSRHRSRKSDHNPWVVDKKGIGVVTALDLTHDPNGGCDAGKIAEALRQHKDNRVKYIIWNRQIANFAAIDGAEPWQWRPYKGSNPHTRHIHISVRERSKLYDSDAGWKGV